MSDLSPAGAAAFGAENDDEYTDGEYTEEASYESDEGHQMSSFGAKIGDGFVGDELLSDSEGFEAAGDDYVDEYDDYVSDDRRRGSRRKGRDPYPTPDPDIALKRGRRQLGRGRGGDDLMDARACGVPHARKAQREEVPPAPEVEVDTMSRRKKDKKNKNKDAKKDDSETISLNFAASELLRAAQMLQAQSESSNSLRAAQFLKESDEKNHIIERPIVFSASGSLADFANKSMKDKTGISLKPKGNISEIFGADKVNVLSMKVVAFDNTLPVSVAIDAPSLPGAKIKKAVTPMNRATMVVVPAKAHADALDMPVYQASKSSDYATKFFAAYPGFNVDNMQDKILLDQELTFPNGTKMTGAALVPIGHPVMSMLKDVNEKNGKQLERSRLVTQLNSYAFDQVEVFKALNALRQLLLESDEAVKSKEVEFKMTRADVSQEAFEQSGSLIGSLWSDPHEIATKKGEPRENDIHRTGLVRLTVLAKFRKVKD